MSEYDDENTLLAAVTIVPWAMSRTGAYEAASLDTKVRVRHKMGLAPHTNTVTYVGETFEVICDSKRYFESVYIDYITKRHTVDAARLSTLLYAEAKMMTRLEKQRLRMSNGGGSMLPGDEHFAYRFESPIAQCFASALIPHSWIAQLNRQSWLRSWRDWSDIGKRLDTQLSARRRVRNAAQDQSNLLYGEVTGMEMSLGNCDTLEYMPPVFKAHLQAAWHIVQAARNEMDASCKQQDHAEHDLLTSKLQMNRLVFAELVTLEARNLLRTGFLSLLERRLPRDLVRVIAVFACPFFMALKGTHPFSCSSR
jgi:hypothetical protein